MILMVSVKFFCFNIATLEDDNELFAFLCSWPILVEVTSEKTLGRIVMALDMLETGGSATSAEIGTVRILTQTGAVVWFCFSDSALQRFQSRMGLRNFCGDHDVCCFLFGNSCQSAFCNVPLPSLPFHCPCISFISSLLLSNTVFYPINQNMDDDDGLSYCSDHSNSRALSEIKDLDQLESDEEEKEDLVSEGKHFNIYRLL